MTKKTLVSLQKKEEKHIFYHWGHVTWMGRVQERWAGTVATSGSSGRHSVASQPHKDGIERPEGLQLLWFQNQKFWWERNPEGSSGKRRGVHSGSTLWRFGGDHVVLQRTNRVRGRWIRCHGGGCWGRVRRCWRLGCYEVQGHVEDWGNASGVTSKLNI